MELELPELAVEAPHGAGTNDLGVKRRENSPLRDRGTERASSGDIEHSHSRASVSRQVSGEHAAGPGSAFSEEDFPLLEDALYDPKATKARTSLSFGAGKRSIRSGIVTATKSARRDGACRCPKRSVVVGCCQCGFGLGVALLLCIYVVSKVERSQNARVRSRVERFLRQAKFVPVETGSRLPSWAAAAAASPNHSAPAEAGRGALQTVNGDARNASSFVTVGETVNKQETCPLVYTVDGGATAARKHGLRLSEEELMLLATLVVRVCKCACEFQLEDAASQIVEYYDNEKGSEGGGSNGDKRRPVPRALASWDIGTQESNTRRFAFSKEFTTEGVAEGGAVVGGELFVSSGDKAPPQWYLLRGSGGRAAANVGDAALEGEGAPSEQLRQAKEGEVGEAAQRKLEVGSLRAGGSEWPHQPQQQRQQKQQPRQQAQIAQGQRQQQEHQQQQQQQRATRLEQQQQRRPRRLQVCEDPAPLLDEMLRGANMVVEGDEGWFYDWFQTLADAYMRRSSHRSAEPTYGVPEGAVLKTVLTGTDSFTDTWFQLEGANWAPFTHPRDSVLHAINYIEYVVGGRQIGPLGTSAHTDRRPLRPVFDGCVRDEDAAAAAVAAAAAAARAAGEADGSVPAVTGEALGGNEGGLGGANEAVVPAAEAHEGKEVGDEEKVAEGGSGEGTPGAADEAPAGSSNQPVERGVGSARSGSSAADDGTGRKGWASPAESSRGATTGASENKGSRRKALSRADALPLRLSIS